MKKPFLVNVEIEFAIFAENEESIYNHPDFREAVLNALDCTRYCVSFISPLNRPPEGWSGDCLVYGSDKDITLKEALNWEPEKESEPADKHTILFPFMEDK